MHPQTPQNPSSGFATDLQILDMSRSIYSFQFAILVVIYMIQKGICFNLKPLKLEQSVAEVHYTWKLVKTYLN